MRKFMFILGTLKPIIDTTKLGDFLLDKLEDYVQDTKNTTDDKVVLPTIRALRLALNIPDNDEKEDSPVTP